MSDTLNEPLRTPPVPLHPEHEALAPVQLIRAFDRKDWDAVARLVDPEIVYEMVLSQEEIRGRAAFVAFNRTYPGDWRIEIDQVVADGTTVVIRLRFLEGDAVQPAIVFFEVADGLIMKQSDWWPEFYDPPAWRAGMYPKPPH